MSPDNDQKNILSVENLVTRFNTPEGTIFAVNGVSFNLAEGETLGVVGESGCGKSVTMLSLLQLIPTPPGQIVNGKAFFHDQDLLQMNAEEIRNVRGSQIGMIFQDPMTSLNPVLTIGKQISEPLVLHLGMTNKEAEIRVIELLRLVGRVARGQDARDLALDRLAQQVAVADRLVVEGDDAGPPAGKGVDQPFFLEAMKCLDHGNHAHARELGHRAHGETRA